MKSTTTPPRWFALFTLVCGLIILPYLFESPSGVGVWMLFPGSFALVMVVAGIRWLVHGSKSLS